MKKIILLIVVVCFQYKMKAGDSLRGRPILKTDLISYLPNFFLNTGRANIELEKPMGKNNSIVTEAGWIYSYGPTKHTWLSYTISQNHSYGLKTSLELRHYFNRRKVWEPLCLVIWPLVFQLHSLKKDNTGIYLAGNIGYRHTVSNIPGDGAPIDLQRVNPSLAFKIGFQSISSGKICVDQSLGLGVQYISTFYRGNAVNDLNSPVFTNENQQIYPIISYSLKIGIEL